MIRPANHADGWVALANGHCNARVLRVTRPWMDRSSRKKWGGGLGERDSVRGCRKLPMKRYAYLASCRSGRLDLLFKLLHNA